MYNFFEQNNSALAGLARISQAVGARADYVQGGGGNTSVKLYDGLMAVKASGFKLIDVSENNGYAVMDAAVLRRFYETHGIDDFSDVEKECAQFAKELIKTPAGLNALRPSVEAGFHSLLDKYVIHSHSVYANLAACVKGGEDVAREALEGADYAWCFVPYTDPGARLTFVILDALKRSEKRPAVIIMQNHGLIVHHDDADTAVSIHSNVNERIAKGFGITSHSFPEIVLNDLGGGEYEGSTKLIIDCLKSGRYDESFFTERPLYPDQMVYLSGSFSFFREAKEGAALADTATGKIRYYMSGEKARALEETIAAVLFIAENASRLGLSVSTMSEAARSFIDGWESEKYRKSVL